MNTIAEFTIIGRVGEIRQVGTTLRVNIASSYSRKDNRGEWVERTRWNEVTVFGESTRGYIRRNIVKGDLVFTSGSMGQTKWEKDGETFYGVTLAAERIERLCKGPNHGDDKDDEPQERSVRADRQLRHPVLTAHPEPGRPRPPRLSQCPIGETPIHGLSDLPHRRMGTRRRRRRLFHHPRIPSAGLYETEAYARKKAARLADQDYENGGDGGFQVVAVGESPFDESRPSLAAWWAAHPHVLDFDDSPF